MSGNGNHHKLAFLTQAPPPGYVAGLGRGAVGFTTRADLGDFRRGPDAATVAAARAKRGEEAEEDREDTEEGQFDDQDPENETGLFAGTVYEKDDEEADRVWDAVDSKMDERRKAKREAREKAELEKLRAERPKIQAQFADLKRGLGEVSQGEWESIPEAGNLTGRKRKKAEKREGKDIGRSYIVPDSILMSGRNQNSTETSLSEEQMQDSFSASAQGNTTSLTDIGEARNKIFSRTLDQAGTVSSLGVSMPSLDTEGYLTSLSTLPTQSTAEVGDMKKAHALLGSIIRTNPLHAPGWIAAARLEELDGKMVKARRVIAQGCEKCPQSEDVWLENARLNNHDNAKVVLAQATQALKGQSVKVWLKASELENDPESSKRVIRKSLEFLPNSVTLWKELVNLESDPATARVLLSGAVGAIPSSEELWLALARLSSPADARKVLNEARKKIPTSHTIWIAALRLTEQTSELPTDETQARLDQIMGSAFTSLSRSGAVLSRDQWMQEALRVESEGSPMTAEAIVKATIDIGLDDDEDRRTVWVQDAEAARDRGQIVTARAAVACALRAFAKEPSIWRFAIDLERDIGDHAALEGLMEKAVTAVPKSETIWLMYAKSKWARGDIAGARQILIRAFQHNIGSEEISLAAAKLESENGEQDAARMLLERARSEVDSRRVWIKSAVLERDEGRYSEALAIIKEGLAKYPDEPKMWLMQAQLMQKPAITPDPTTAIRSAREIFSRGTRSCPTSVPLWINSSQLEEKAGLVIRARAILEKARLANPHDDALWLESAKVEERSGAQAEYRRLLARGLQECPASGLLYAESIFAEPRPTRKTRSADALKKTGDDAKVLCAVAQLFWTEGKHEKARQWLERALKADPVWGDGYAWMWKYETEHLRTLQDESSAQDDAVLQRLAAVASRHQVRYGERFQQVNKSEEAVRGRWTMEKVLQSVADQLQLRK